VLADFGLSKDFGYRGEPKPFHVVTYPGQPELPPWAGKGAASMRTMAHGEKRLVMDKAYSFVRVPEGGVRAVLISGGNVRVPRAGSDQARRVQLCRGLVGPGLYRVGGDVRSSKCAPELMVDDSDRQVPFRKTDEEAPVSAVVIYVVVLAAKTRSSSGTASCSTHGTSSFTSRRREAGPRHIMASIRFLGTLSTRCVAAASPGWTPLISATGQGPDVALDGAVRQAACVL